MAYVTNGNLYYQNGSKLPLQLTHSGEDQQPLAFSEDGKKVFFTRDVIPSKIYSINVDGSQEQALVTNDLLLTFGSNSDKSTTPCYPVLVPHTPFLLFSTCYRPDPGEPTIIDNYDLFLLDTDTNKTKRLLQKGEGGYFYVSPNGTMLAIDRQNAIDILNMEGKLIHHNIATYPRSEPYVLWSKMYWLPNSSEFRLSPI